MADANFYPIALVVLAAIIVVFAMKYAASVYNSRLGAKRLTSADKALSALQQELSQLTARVGAIEKLLREVE